MISSPSSPSSSSKCSAGAHSWPPRGSKTPKRDCSRLVQSQSACVRMNMVADSQPVTPKLNSNQMVCDSPAQAIPGALAARLSARREAALSAKRSRLAKSKSNPSISTPSRTPSRQRRGRVANLRAQGEDPTWSGLVPRQRPLDRRPDNNALRGTPTPVCEEENSDLMALSSILIEIEQPTGVLRLPLVSAEDIMAAKDAVKESERFVSRDLPAIATEVRQNVSGPTFQALLCHAYGDKRRCHSTGSVDVYGSKMYAIREDRAAGASIDLLSLSGGAERVDMLAQKATRLVEMLRIKIEDDGDLAQASKTLRDISRFFERLSTACQNEGITEPDGMSKLRL